MKCFSKYISEQFLLEAKYEDMFQKYKLENPYAKKHLQRVIDDYINWAKKTLKKEDRIIWFLRWARIKVASEYAGYKALLDNNIDPDLNKTRNGEESPYAEGGIFQKAKQESVKSEIKNIEKKLSRDLPENDIEELTLDYPIQRLQRSLEHAYSLDYPPINDIVLNKQTPSELKRLFYDLEDKYKKEHARLIPDERSGEDKSVIIKFPNGWTWFNLNEPYSSLEACAMGHCGNQAAGPSHLEHRVLSLREPVKVGDKLYWKPHLTFIYDTNNKSLGEMKGYGNQKPQPKYHPYIIELLTQKELPIETVAGGGYLPQSNFSLKDLTPEQIKKVTEKNSELTSYGKKVYEDSKWKITIPKNIENLYAMVSGHLKLSKRVADVFNSEAYDLDMEDISINNVYMIESLVEDSVYVLDLVLNVFLDTEGKDLATEEHQDKDVPYHLQKIFGDKVYNFFNEKYKFGTVNFIFNYAPYRDKERITSFELIDGEIEDFQSYDMAAVKIKSLEGIEQLKYLERLTIRNTPIMKDLTALKDCTNLKFLFLYDNDIRSLRGIESLTKLQILAISDNKISSLKELRNMRDLTKVAASNNRLHSLKDAEHIKRLSIFYIDGNPLPKGEKERFRKARPDVDFSTEEHAERLKQKLKDRETK